MFLSRDNRDLGVARPRRAEAGSLLEGVLAQARAVQAHTWPSAVLGILGAHLGASGSVGMQPGARAVNS